MNEVGLDASVLLFAFAVSCATGLLFGLVPALQFSRPDLQSRSKRVDAATRNPAPRPSAACSSPARSPSP